MVTKLLEGHSRFRSEYFENERELFETLAKGVQQPVALMLSCCDARVVPNIMVNASPGELFVVRNIANIVPPFGRHLANRSVGAAIEYALHFLKVPHVIVCGHTQCGGLQALAEGLGTLEAETPTLAAWLQDAVVVRERIASRWPDATPEVVARQLVFENVVVQLENLLTYPVVQRALDENRVEIHGWVYDLVAATLRVYEPKANEFRPLQPR
ncbi:carbonic anhydrase [Hyalangium sp.]|uniref:carbonic anhydrase n=1 Tax=Hyalangium sp. TaxID=2028555 RepID=UPI002D29DCD0|nr:carbonic anhydrase [Hyalangium sp.]HYH94609.1 carbonic anhydrase [Hyalangium sp.]